MALFTRILLASFSLSALWGGCATTGFEPARFAAVGANPSALLYVDTEQIGRSNLVVANADSNTVSVFPYLSGSKFDYPVGLHPSTLASGDVDGDGKIDLIVGNAGSGTVSVLLGTGYGMFRQGGSFFVGGAPIGLAALDLNGDKRAEILVNRSGLSVYSYNVHAAPILVTPGSGHFAFATAMQDGRPLVVTADTTRTLTVYGPDGSGGLISVAQYPLASDPETLFLEDVNGDGKLDVILSENSPDIKILINDGQNGFQSSALVPGISSLSGVAVGDFNGDGLPDLAVSPSGNSVVLLLNDGHGSFTQQEPYPLNLTAGALAAGRSDIDLKYDLAIAFPQSNSVALLYGCRDMEPPTTTATPSPLPNENGWHQSDVYVNFQTADNSGGTGIRELRYWTTGAQVSEASVSDVSRPVYTHITTEGITTVHYSATDAVGNVEPEKTLVVRIDRTPPVITGMPQAGCLIWPPNHQMVEVAQLAANDSLSGIGASGLFLEVTSSEPATPGESDFSVVNGRIQLRADRLGGGPGRTYSITATATDLAGNTSSAASSCLVPPNQK